jgi:hypothetical protein
MTTPSRPVLRVQFVGRLERDDGTSRRPVSAAEVNAEWLLLAMRGHAQLAGIRGERDPQFEKYLRDLLARPGRPSAAIRHREWAERFKQLYAVACAQHERYHVDGDRPPNNIEVCQLVVDELGLNVTSRAVWDAVKPLI